MMGRLIRKFLNGYVRKFFTYFSIAIIGLWSQTADLKAATLIMNEADSWDDADGSGRLADPTLGDHVTGTTYAITFNRVSSAGVNAGDITMTSGDIIITNADNDGAFTLTIASLTTSLTAGVLNIDMIDQQTDMMIIISGAVSIAGTLDFLNADATSNRDGVLDVEGNFEITGTTTIKSPDDGDTTLKLAGSTITLTGLATLNDTTGKSILYFDGTSNQTVTFSGGITGAIKSEGTIDVANTSGIVTFKSAIGASKSLLEVEVSADAEAIFESTIDVQTLDIDNDVTLFENGSTIGTDSANTGALNIAASSVITINDTIVAGETIFTGTTVATGLSGFVIADTTTFKMPANFTSGTITFWNGDNGVVTADIANSSMTDTPLTDYSATAADSNLDMTFTVSKKSDATCASELGVNVDVCNAFEQARDSVISDSALDASAEDAFTTILNAGTTTDTQMAKQVAPQMDGFTGAMTAINSVSSGVNLLTSTRLASLRQGDEFATGFAAGGSALDNSIYIKPFGTFMSADKNSGVDGFENQTVGITIGYDHRTPDGGVLGFSYSHSATKVDGDGAGNVSHDFNTHLLSIYGDRTTDKSFIEFMLNLGLSPNDTSRTVDGGGIGRTITGKYDSYQAGFKISAGLPYQTAKAGYVTPIFGLSTTIVDAESFKETGGTNLNLTIDPESFVTAIGSLGLKWHGVIDHKGGTSVPELRIGVGYDISGDAPSTLATYTGGGNEFLINGAKDELSGTLGLGYTLSYAGVSFGINIDAEAKEHSIAGTGSAMLKVKF